jgi:hypothetical protein
MLRFREGVQSLGLLRKHKGILLLTNAGVAAQRDADRLWEHMAGRFINVRLRRLLELSK